MKKMALSLLHGDLLLKKLGIPIGADAPRPVMGARIGMSSGHMVTLSIDYLMTEDDFKALGIEVSE